MIDTCQLRINQKSESELVHTGFLSARLLLEVKKSSLAVEVRAVRDSPRKPNSMLSKSRRLTSNDVTRVLKQGRSKRALFLSMKFLELQTPLRTSAVVSKSVARRAVEAVHGLHHATPRVDIIGEVVAERGGVHVLLRH